MNSSNLAVILHGGAGRFNPDHARLKPPFLRQALEAAWAELTAGKPGEFAIAAALKVMEGCEYFNAGYGGYPNADGIVLLDIGLMRGNHDFVSVLNLRRVKFPSAVVLDLLQKNSALMTIWTHSHMLELDNAPDFVKERYGYVKSHEELVAPFVKKLMRSKHGAEIASDGDTHGTVGCVVRDASGKLCAGTSTGGVSLKVNGRIGDTPIIGQGVYADNAVGALSTTGHGESFMASQVSCYILGEMRRILRADPQAFAKDKDLLNNLLSSEMAEMGKRYSKSGGAIIVIPPTGAPSFTYNSAMLSLAWRTGSPTQIDAEDCAVLTH